MFLDFFDGFANYCVLVTTLLVTGLLNLSTYKVVKLLDIYFEDLMDLVDLKKNYYCYGFY
jgi:hypothetical protein